MKRFSPILIVLCFILLSLSCSERFPVDFPKSQPRIVIEALLTDHPGPYYVRLTKTCDSIKVPSWSNDYTDPVFNAMVIISSSDGIVDTLKQFHYPTYYPEFPDSLLGYYFTRKWTAKEGVLYYLDVYFEGKHYHSEETMQPSLLIDTCIFKFQQGDFGKQNGFLPIVHFNNSCNNSGYYMTNLTLGKSSNPNYFTNRYGNFSLFPGIEITDCSVGLYDLSDPYFPYLKDHLAGGSPWGDTCSILLFSLSKTAYYFHTDLFKQLTSDGGSFKPSPATPIGNISGDVIGIFQVSSVSRYVISQLPKELQ